MRQLAAIMFTDLAGYTAFMGRDETRAIEQLRISRKIHRDLIAKYEGVFIKEMGDGNLAKFSSALDGVLCAKEILSLAKDLDCKIRIGIHLGDVRIENEDLYGDSVNLASRLQSIAEPGGIFISDSVYKAIKSNPVISVSVLGDVKLKNVKEQVKTYYVNGAGLAVPSKKRIRELTERGNIRALAVLPFRGLSGNAEQQYFVDGMQDALIGELSQISSLRVISRTSTGRYRNTEKNIQEIATDLGVDGVLEATVLRSDNKVRISAQLIKAYPVEEPVWTGVFEKEIRDIFSLLNEVIKEITSKIGATLTSRESENLEETYEVDPKALEAYLKGLFHWEKLKDDDLKTSLSYFGQATEIDPNFAAAFSGMAGVWAGRMQMGLVPPAEAIPKMKEYIEKTFTLNTNIADTHFWNAGVKVWTDWNWDGGEESFERAIELNPNHSLAHAYYSHLLTILGRISEALIQIEYALELDPFNLLIKSLYGMVLNYAREFNKAEEVLTSILSDYHNHPIALSTLRSTYHNLGDFQRAYKIFKQSYKEKGDLEAVDILEHEFRKNGYHAALEKIAELMIRRSDESYSTPWQIATLFTRAGVNEKAIHYLNKAFEINDPNMPYLGIDPIFDQLKEEMGYIQLLKKMKLDVLAISNVNN